MDYCFSRTRHYGPRARARDLLDCSERKESERKVRPREIVYRYFPWQTVWVGPSQRGRVARREYKGGPGGANNRAEKIQGAHHARRALWPLLMDETRRPRIMLTIATVPDAGLLLDN